MENHDYIRTVEDVNTVLELARVKESQIKSLTQVLYSKLDDKSADIKLLEVDDHIVSSLKEGQTLYFKGGIEDSLVLTTDSRTYNVREAETSNSLVLFSNVKFNDQIPSDENPRRIETANGAGIFHTYYESSHVKPHLDRLPILLGPTAFNGIEYEKQVDQSKLYDWEKLRDVIQASDNELKEALSHYSIANIDGYYRLISFESETKCLTNMLDVLHDNSGEIDEVNKEELFSELEELIPRPVFDLIFHKYTTKNEINDFYTYDVEKVCKFLAQVLLSAMPKIEYNKFMEAWKIGVPEKMKPKAAYLNGIAVIVRNSQTGRKEVVSFPESKLSDNISTRFDELFKVKDKWTIEEITPYISKFAEKNSNVNFLLTKHARASVINGVRYYSSKYAK